ncbi:MAG: DUF268 domain-containing protein [Bacteroidetes bacterium]|nr:DUF268 domain-containing protein [Bacteroidota bacterium]
MIQRLNEHLKYKRSLKNILPVYERFVSLEKETKKRFHLSKKNIVAQLSDNSANTDFDRHYIYHPAWAARVLNETKPKSHIDISSTLHFCSIVSAFIPIKFYDYRPAKISLSNLSSEAQDLTKLNFDDNSIESLSCMHTVEHIGLGRYGDTLNYDGDLIAMKELARVLKQNGNLLFVVPIAHEAKIIFNAHRIYTKEQIETEMLSYGLKLKEFSLIPEQEADGGIVKNPNKTLLEKQNYGCGCFWFTK